MKRAFSLLLAFSLGLCAPPPSAWGGISVVVPEAGAASGSFGATGASVGTGGAAPQTLAPSLELGGLSPALDLPANVPTSSPFIPAPAVPLSQTALPAISAAVLPAVVADVLHPPSPGSPAAVVGGLPEVGPARAAALPSSDVPADPEVAAKTAEALGRSGEKVASQLHDPFGTAASGAISAGREKEEAASALTPSPDFWEDQIFYFLMTDRFARGPHATPEGDPADGRSVHGGDLEGLIGKLDYLAGMGATVIVLPPVLRNTPKGYHGYHTTSLTEMNPHQGTMEIYKRLVREAHARGIYVIQDKVLNHMGLVFDYEGNDQWEGRNKMPKPVAGWRVDLSKEGFGEEDFYRGGILWDWNDHDQERFADPFFDLRQLNTANPRTQDKLIASVLRWISETDVDGIRLDAFKHFDEVFRFRLAKAVREHAAKLGKKNFFIFGEIMTREDKDIVPYLGEHGLSSAYNYPAYFRDLLSLYGLAPTRWLEDSLRMTREAFGSLALLLVRFLSTHDVPRFLKDKEMPLYSRPNTDIKGWFEDNLRLAKEAFGAAGEDMIRFFFGLNVYEVLRHRDLPRTLMAAAALSAFLPGIPMVYYGDEQAMRQPAGKPFEPGNREDMFAEGAYKSASSGGDKFDTSSPVYRFFRKLADVRKAYPALRRGETWVRWSDHAGPGIFAFSRIYDGEEVLVVVNTSGDARSADMWVDAGLSPPGTDLVDVLDGDYAPRVYGAVAQAESGMRRARPEETPQGSGVNVQIGPLGVRVLVRRSRQKV